MKFLRIPKPSRETVNVGTWWIQWTVFQAFPFMNYRYVGGSVSSMSLPSDSLLWLCSLVPWTIASLIRWRYLPTITKRDTALTLHIVGMGLSCYTCIFGLFLFPPHQLFIAVLSGLCVFQFAPIYARRYWPEKESSPTTSSET